MKRFSRPHFRVFPPWPVIAGAMLALALPAAAADYVGTSTCMTCHIEKYRQVTNSIHMKMIRKITPDGTLPGPHPSMTASVEHVHGNLAAPKAPPLADVTYVMGGWYKEESYIKEGVDPGTGEKTFKVTRYEWDPIKGTYRDDRDGTRDWLTKCAGCHSTGYNPATKSFPEVNVGCEACHGPGSAHVASLEASDIIIDRSNEGCGYCHIRAENVASGSFTNKQFNFPIGYQLGHPETLQFIPQTLSDTASSFFPDGTSKRHRQQYLDMNYPGFRVTKHHANNVTCTSCHDPHTSGILTMDATPPANANAKTNGIYGILAYNSSTGATNFIRWDGDGLRADTTCVTCHVSTSPNHAHYFTPKAQSATLECIDCHMPDVINIDNNTLRGALHPHTFKGMRPEASMKYGPDAQANSCTYRCHQDQGATKTERATWAASYLQSHVEMLAAGAGTAGLRLHGVRGFTYTIEGTPDLKTWTALSTNVADVAGVLMFQDTSAPGTYRFYRAIEK